MSKTHKAVINNNFHFPKWVALCGQPSGKTVGLHQTQAVEEVGIDCKNCIRLLVKAGRRV